MGAGKSSGGADVLVVEDHANMREVLRLACESLLGCSVACAPDGAAAARWLACAGRAPPRVVVTDLDLPVMSGRQLVAWLRLRPPPLRDVPVLIVAGSLPDASGPLAGIPALLKPFELDELFAALAPFLRVPRGPQERTGASGLRVG